MNDPIQYEMPIYRPPSEGRSVLIPVTNGCSHNKCTFCTMYRSKDYRVNSFEKIEGDLLRTKQYYDSAGYEPNRFFLCDGDALSAPFETLLKTTSTITRLFPSAKRIGIYATVSNILEKSDAELTELRENNLETIYLGMESGADSVLKVVNKGNNQEELIEACLKVKRAGLKISMIAMLGLGGLEKSEEHARETAHVFSIVAPDYFSFLTTVAQAGTPYRKMVDRGDITPLSVREHLEQMYSILENVEIKDGFSIFRANHVTNMYPLGGTFPKDKQKVLDTLSSWIENTPVGTYLDPDMQSL